MLPSMIRQPANSFGEAVSKPRMPWLTLFLSFLYILWSLSVGVVLLYLPWSEIWENNYLLYLYPRIRVFVANPFFKGAVLGLGIANILIGIREIVRFKST